MNPESVISRERKHLQPATAAEPNSKIRVSESGLMLFTIRPVDCWSALVPCCVHTRFVCVSEHEDITAEQQTQQINCIFKLNNPLIGDGAALGTHSRSGAIKHCK